MTETCSLVPVRDLFDLDDGGAFAMADFLVFDLHNRDDPTVDGETEGGHGQRLHIANHLFGRLARRGEHVNFTDGAVVTDYSYGVHRW